MGRVGCVLICLLMLLNTALAQDNQPVQRPKSEPFVRKQTSSDAGYRAAQVAFIGSLAFDLGSTLKLQPGWKESNPLLGHNPGQQIAVGAGLGLLTLWQAHKLKRQGHPRLAKACLLVGLGLHLGAASYNTTVSLR